MAMACMMPHVQLNKLERLFAFIRWRSLQDTYTVSVYSVCQCIIVVQVLDCKIMTSNIL
jgi:hypothetical protein